jgi:hypothetical protein
MKVLIVELVPLEKIGMLLLFFALPHVRTQQENGPLQISKRISDFPVSKMLRNKFLLPISHLVYGIYYRKLRQWSFAY